MYTYLHLCLLFLELVDHGFPAIAFNKYHVSNSLQQVPRGGREGGREGGLITGVNSILLPCHQVPGYFNM